MGPDLAADAVFERRDDLAAGGVILRVGGEHQHQVERQPDRVALNLHIAFLHDVEQADLNLPGQVGQLVNREDAAIRPGKQAVVDGQLVGDVLAAARRLDRVDIADHVGDRDVGSGELLDVALVAMQPRDGGLFAALGDQFEASPAGGAVRIVVDFTTLHVRGKLVEQRGELPDEACFGLAAQTQKDEIVAGKNGVDYLRDDRIVVSQNAWKQGIAPLNLTDEIAAEFVLDGSDCNCRFGIGTFAKRA